jgi:uncharacterized damage-inducible protein DinB
MSLGALDVLVAEFERESSATRRVLLRVPEAHMMWQPHPRSMTLGRLATHIAELPGWLTHILAEDPFDLAAIPATPACDTTTAAILARFDDCAARARTALRAATDTALLARWTLRKDGQEIVSLPRGVAARTEGLYHLTHHRGQLTVYLRLLNVPVPPLYGPTADEGRL